jgi:hypothetical protein
MLTGCSTVRSSHAEMVALTKQKAAAKEAANLPVIVEVQAPSATPVSAGAERTEKRKASEPPAIFPIVDLDLTETSGGDASADVVLTKGEVVVPAAGSKAVTKAVTAALATEESSDGPLLVTSYPTPAKPKPLPSSVVENTGAPSPKTQAVPGLEDLTAESVAADCDACTPDEMVEAPQVILFDEHGNQITLASDTAPAGHVTITPADADQAENKKKLEATKRSDPPAPLPFSSTSAKVTEDELLEAPIGTTESEYSPPPAERVEVAEVIAPVRIVGVYGVGPDREGIADNFSTRIGGSYYEIDQSASAGVTGILEGSGQIHESPFFVHGGVASELINNEWPVGFTLGMSRLATIEGGRVVRPWIFSVAYDGYFDSTFFQTNDTVYLDQIRGLVGYAVKPWLDVGVWGAKGLRSDFGIRSQNGALFNITGRFADRVAGYSAFDLWNCLVILSGGWEEGPGTYFGEGDIWIPLTRGCNLFGGAGFSDSGALDAICGLEFKFGHDKHPWLRHLLTKHHKSYGDGYDPCNPCDALACCSDMVCCGPRYRGGWANDPYRGALRVITPSRMRRMFEDPAPRLLPPVVAEEPPVVIPPPVVINQPPPEDPGNGSVDPQTPDCGCEPGHPSRNLYRPRRDSRLSDWLSQHQTTTP